MVKSSAPLELFALFLAALSEPASLQPANVSTIADKTVSTAMWRQRFKGLFTGGSSFLRLPLVARARSCKRTEPGDRPAGPPGCCVQRRENPADLLPHVDKHTH